jgi:hypothetical protein
MTAGGIYPGFHGDFRRQKTVIFILAAVKTLNPK